MLEEKAPEALPDVGGQEPEVVELAHLPVVEQRVEAGDLSAFSNDPDLVLPHIARRDRDH